MARLSIPGPWAEDRRSLGGFALADQAVHVVAELLRILKAPFAPPLGDPRLPHPPSHLIRCEEILGEESEHADR